MKILKFQGYSDDTFECDGGKGVYCDFDNCANGEPIRIWVQAAKEALLVIGQYADGPSAGWQIAVAPAEVPGQDDEQHIPDWPMAITRSDRPYSPMLVITAPDDVAVWLVDDEGKKP